MPNSNYPTLYIVKSPNTSKKPSKNFESITAISLYKNDKNEYELFDFSDELEGLGMPPIKKSYYSKEGHLEEVGFFNKNYELDRYVYYEHEKDSTVIYVHGSDKELIYKYKEPKQFDYNDYLEANLTPNVIYELYTNKKFDEFDKNNRKIKTTGFSKESSYTRYFIYNEDNNLKKKVTEFSNGSSYSDQYKYLKKNNEFFISEIRSFDFNGDINAIISFSYKFDNYGNWVERETIIFNANKGYSETYSTQRDFDYKEE